MAFLKDIKKIKKNVAELIQMFVKFICKVGMADVVCSECIYPSFTLTSIPNAHDNNINFIAVDGVTAVAMPSDYLGLCSSLAGTRGFLVLSYNSHRVYSALQIHYFSS